MRSINTLLVTLSILTFSFTANAGGPWLVKKNRAFLQLQAIPSAYRYRSIFTGTLLSPAQGVNRATYVADFSLYGEYGLTDKFNLIAKVPFQYVSTGELNDEVFFQDVLPSADLFGLGNVELDLKYAILDKETKAAVSINTAWNTSARNDASGIATGYDAHAFGATFHIGRGYEKHYGFAEVGYQHYTNGYSGIIEIGVEHGWKVGEHMNLALSYSGRHSLKNGSRDEPNYRQTGSWTNDQEWMVVSGKVNYEREDGWGVNFALPVAPIYLKRVGFAGNFSFGLYKKFN